MKDGLTGSLTGTPSPGSEGSIKRSVGIDPCHAIPWSCVIGAKVSHDN
jgi:hypothetical protein